MSDLVMTVDLTVQRVDEKKWQWSTSLVARVPGDPLRERSSLIRLGHERTEEKAWRVGRDAAELEIERMKRRELWKGEAKSEVIAVIDPEAL